MRLQFRLRTLMIVVTLFCVLVGGYVVWQKRIVAERKAWLQHDREISIMFAPPERSDLSWVRQQLGDFKADLISVEPALLIDADYVQRLRAAFPEATIEPKFFGRRIP